MKKIWIILIIILIIIAMYLYQEVTRLEVSKYYVKTTSVPNSFSGYKIAHISDFHNTKSARLKKNIINSLKKEKADILVITGDFIDSRRTNMNVSLEFIKKIKNIPIYYVAGNHESRIKEYPKFKEGLKKLGVTVLENEKVLITKNDESINLIGLQDPSFETGETNTEEMKKIVSNYLTNLKDEKKYNVVLLHRPELIKTLSENQIDLAFCGHAHGGQVILPFVGPIIAPNQGFFPKITSGVHQESETYEVISRGIGNSLCPIRFNNNPELVYLIIEKK